MQRQHPLVIVDNTNTMVREMMPYFDMAVQYQYRVEIEEPTSPWWVNDIAPYLGDKEGNRKQLLKMARFLYEKNQQSHKVPLASIEKMLFRYHYNVTVEQFAAIYKRNIDAGLPGDGETTRHRSKVQIKMKLAEFQLSQEEITILERLEADNFVQTSFLATADFPPDQIETVKKLPFIVAIL